MAGVEPSRAGCHVDPVRLDHSLLVLPVAVGPAGVGVVLDVQDRDVRAVQQALAAIVDEPQLDSRPPGSRGRGRTDDQKPQPIGQRLYLLRRCTGRGSARGLTDTSSHDVAAVMPSRERERVSPAGRRTLPFRHSQGACFACASASERRHRHGDRFGRAPARRPYRPRLPHRRGEPSVYDSRYRRTADSGQRRLRKHGSSSRVAERQTTDLEV